MVDLWFAALSVAARKKLDPTDLTDQKTSAFIHGSIFDRDSWRIQMVMLITIAADDNYKGNIHVVTDPSRIDGNS